MPYIGHTMSYGAARAHRQGYLPLSSISASILKEHGFTYPRVFFIWLCKQHYIPVAGFHHASAVPKIVRYYNPNTIEMVAKHYNLVALYRLYRGQTTFDQIMAERGVQYVRIAISGKTFSANRIIYYDCILIDSQIMWSKNVAFDMSHSQIVEMCGPSKPLQWINKNTDKILHKALLFETVYPKSYR